MYPAFVPGNLGSPTTDDTRDATPRFARGLATPIELAAGGTQQLLSHNSFEYRVIRCQLAEGTPIPPQAELWLVVEHGVDGGPTIARARLNDWGVAVQVPAGQIKVSVRIIEVNPANPIPPGTKVSVFTTCAAALLSRRVVAVTVPPSALFGSRIIPPPFAVQWDAWYLGPLGGSMTLQPDTTNIAFSVDANNLPHTAGQATPFTVIGSGANGSASILWEVFE